MVMTHRSRRRYYPTYFIWVIKGTTPMTKVLDFYRGFVVVAQNEVLARAIIHESEFW